MRKLSEKQEKKCGFDTSACKKSMVLIVFFTFFSFQNFGLFKIYYNFASTNLHIKQRSMSRTMAMEQPKSSMIS